MSKEVKRYYVSPRTAAVLALQPVSEPPADFIGLVLASDYDAMLAERQWISVDDRMPPPGETVMVYSPPEPGDHPGDVRISFDAIDPESDGDYWIAHGENYEHWCCIAKGGDDIDWHGPSEKAPYTHWMSLPPPPAPSPESAQGDRK